MAEVQLAKLCTVVVMEIRSRLQSVNVYLYFDSLEANDIGIQLNTDNIEIIYGDKVERIYCKDFTIVRDSISSLIVRDNLISFRFCTNSIKQESGTFKSGIMKMYHEETEGSNSPVANLLDTSFEYDIQCVNCSQCLCKSIKFEKILPLPSENVEPNEWFCHAPNSESTMNLEPRVSDLFYSFCYYYVNLSLVKEKLLVSNSKIVCKRCLSELGILLKDSTCKLWFHTTSLYFNGRFYRSTPLEDCFLMLRNCLKESLFGSLKILLSHETSPKLYSSIFLWIIEKNLQIYICDSKRDTNEIIEVAKVLFKYDDSSSILRQQWQSDSMVIHLDISKVMIIKLLEHLYDMHKYIPEDFSMSNDFYISYVCLYNKISEIY